MAPRVARRRNRRARALLPPARHQAGLLGRPRAPRVPAAMGDRRCARYAPFRLLFFSADARVRLLRVSHSTRESGDARARSPRRHVSRRSRPPLRARWDLADLAVPPTPSPLSSYLQLGLPRSPTWSKNWRRYATAGRTASWTCQVRMFSRRHDTSRWNRGIGAAREMPTRASSHRARRHAPRVPPVPSISFLKALSFSDDRVSEDADRVSRTARPRREPRRATVCDSRRFENAEKKKK